MKLIGLWALLAVLSSNVQAAGNSESRATESRTSAPDTS
ncbi:MAG: hypothetical protein RL368_2053, partial [Pseudomonadota bacterium]